MASATTMEALIITVPPPSPTRLRRFERSTNESPSEAKSIHQREAPWYRESEMMEGASASLVPRQPLAPKKMAAGRAIVLVMIVVVIVGGLQTCLPAYGSRRDPGPATDNHSVGAFAPPAAMPALGGPAASSLRLAVEGAFDRDGDIEILRRELQLKPASAAADGTTAIWRAAALGGCSGELRTRDSSALRGVLSCGAASERPWKQATAASEVPRLLPRGTVGWTTASSGSTSFFILLQDVTSSAPILPQTVCCR